MAKTEKKAKFKTVHSEARKKPEYFTTPMGESLTNISRQEDTDIKIMCAKYGLKSVLARCEVTEPMYGWDLTQTTDVNERLEVRERMKQYFEEQPAKIRKEFGDNFNRFYEMYMTGDTEKMKYLGIIKEEIKDEKILETGINTNIETNIETGNTATTTNSETINN